MPQPHASPPAVSPQRGAGAEGSAVSLQQGAEGGSPGVCGAGHPTALFWLCHAGARGALAKLPCSEQLQILYQGIWS